MLLISSRVFHVYYVLREAGQAGRTFRIIYEILKEN
jgi:hypothetical protein